MADAPEVIHRQMEETRTALQEKLETLEEQVKNTVQGATEAVSDTVETVKDAVQETVATVKDTVQETVTSVKETLDLSRQVRQHPWGMFLGATAVGFLGTRWLRGVGTPTRLAGQPRATTNGEMANGRYTNVNLPPQPLTSAQPNGTQPSVKRSWFSDRYQEEMTKLKALALGVIGGTVREILTESTAPTLAEPIKEMVDGITAKLGGRVMESPIWPHTSARGSH